MNTLLSLLLLAQAVSIDTVPLERWRLVPDLRIGSPDAPGYALSEVLDLAVSPDGAMYVVTWKRPAVDVFDADGRFVRTIGRRGGGPGEFAQPGRVGMLGDTLWVADGGIGRVSFFRAGGEFLTSVNLIVPPIADHVLGIQPHGLLSDRSILGQPTTGAQIMSRGAARSLPLLRFDWMMERIDTLAWLGTANAILEVQLEAAGIWRFSFQPLADHSLLDVFPDGSGAVIVERRAADRARDARFRVTRLGPVGDTVFAVAYAYRPVELTDDLADSLVTALVAGRPKGVPAGAYEKAVREALYLPEFLPPIDRLVAGRDGTIWLKREAFGPRSAHWTVLDADGRPRAHVTAPPGLNILVADTARVWGVVHDDLDVPYVVRYRVARADRD